MTLKVSRSFSPKLKPLSMAQTGVALFHSIKELPNIDWDRVATLSDNLFLQRPYLSVLEENPPTGMQFCYLLFYRKNEVVGLAVCQLQHFKASRSLGLEQEKKEEKTPCFFTAYSRFLKNLVASRVEFNTMVCGNLLLTGEHGFYFTTPDLQGPVGQQLLVEAMDNTQVELEKQGFLLSAMLIKDYYPTLQPSASALLQKSFSEFTVQPNMVLPIREEWTCMEDYLKAFQSKYRVRAKRAFKKAVDFRKQEFDLEQIQNYESEMYALYRSVAENSGFNLINLNSSYLVALKRELPDNFHCYAYFLEDRLVAFYTTIDNGEELEAHFLGFDKSLNHGRQVYLNILYDLVRVGIEGGHRRVVFARTAMEIKSSVGAEAIEMYCYVRHRNTITNRFINPLFDYLKPKQDDWDPRHPFKSS